MNMDAWTITRLRLVPITASAGMQITKPTNWTAKRPENSRRDLSRWYVRLVRDRTWMEGDSWEKTAAYVARHIRSRYPSFDIPYHSRWRHFSVGGIDRWRRLAEKLAVSKSTRRKS